MRRVPSELDDFEFDLRGFLVLRDALELADVATLNAAFDRFPDLEVGEWYGGSQRRDDHRNTGLELHNVFDCGDSTFDLLIDHPAWIEYARLYAGEEGTYVAGVTIDENIASIRRAGGNHPVHSGGHDTPARTQYRFQNGRFRCRGAHGGG
ncbi:MAG: hypothetical protein AAGD33_02255 [Actinomycetota bacterium]